MKKYISPLAIENDILAEAIYAASGFDISGGGNGGNGGDGDNSNPPSDGGDGGSNPPSGDNNNPPSGDNNNPPSGDNNPPSDGGNGGSNPPSGDNNPPSGVIPFPENGPRDPATNYGRIPGKDYSHDPDCWTIKPYITQTNTNNDIVSENWAVCRVQCDHSNIVVHHSENTQFVLVFDRAISAATFEGSSNNVTVNGNTVTVLRPLLGDSYGSGDNYNSEVKVWPEDIADMDSVTVKEAYIYCAHGVNVQGGFD